MSPAADRPAILLVDDEPNVLDGLRRQLRGRFEVVCAGGGDEALACLAGSAAFAVILSDMRMPGMNGVQLLRRARECAPDTTRMMLTGNADQQTAAEAVNEGSVFRFLTKPCDPETLRAALDAAVGQHRLVRAERELLEQTLSGSVRVLMESVQLVSPLAFGRASRLRDSVRHIARRLRLPDPWKYEMAAALSQLGCLAVPPETLRKAHARQALSSEEALVVSQHPHTAARLIAEIPRLEPIAEMISRQLQPPAPLAWDEAHLGKRPVEAGAELLKTALALEDRLGHGLTAEAALEELRLSKPAFATEVLDALSDYHAHQGTPVLLAVTVAELTSGMVLDEDALSGTGLLLAHRGVEVTPVVIQFLENFKRSVGVREPLRVRSTLPAGSSNQEGWQDHAA